MARATVARLWRERRVSSRPSLQTGKKGELSEEMRNFGVAVGWGGLPKEGAVYPFPDAVES